MASLANLAGGSPLPFKAGGTVTANRLVKLDSTAGQVVHAAAEGDLTVGVALNSAASGEQVQVQMFGVACVTADSAVTLGDEVEANTGGKCKTAAGAAARSVGVALNAAAADGDIVEVLLSTPNVKGPANS